MVEVVWTLFRISMNTLFPGKTDRNRNEEREENAVARDERQVQGFPLDLPLLFSSFFLPCAVRNSSLLLSSRGRCTRVSFAELRSSTMLLVHERDPGVVGLRFEATP